jgi:Ca2+-binding EF-hand superfamily protein
MLLVVVVVVVCQGSLDSLSKMLFFFNSADEDGDKQLSYNEFRKACRDFLSECAGSSGGSGRSGRAVLSDSDIRYLFNHFDKSGDGFLSYDEVIKSLQVKNMIIAADFSPCSHHVRLVLNALSRDTQGEITPRRREVIHQVFTQV